MHQTFGARLRSQRERQEIALSVIAEQSKIRVSLLDGLERDDLSQWPGGIFRRSYLRTYAQAIGLDPDVVVREFLELFPDPEEHDVPSVLAAARGVGDSSRPRTRLGLLLGSALDAFPVRRPSSLPSVVPQTDPAGHANGAVQAQARHSTAGPRLPLVATAVAPLASPVADVDDPGAISMHEDAAQEDAVSTAGPGPDADVEDMVDPALERLADVCTKIASASNGALVAEAVSDAARTLDAAGLILWVWDPDDDALCASLAHGYSHRLLNELPRVRRCDDNPVAAAFRGVETHVVDSAGGATGAVVVPVINAYGCVGVLALELRAGVERHALVRVMATLLAAQLATLVAPVSSLAAATA
jgi:hypothetical protein